MSDGRKRHGVGDGLRPLVPLAATWTAASILLTALTLQRGVPYEDLLLDPAAANGWPWYTGLVSNLGILGWTTAAVSAGGGAWISRLAGRAGAERMCREGALLGLLLGLDDLLQLHIVVAQQLDLPKIVAPATYGALTLAWVHGNRTEIVRTRTVLLGCVGAMLAASVAIDGVGTSSAALLAEDSTKFLGIVAWAVYHVVTAGDIARSVVRTRAEMSRPALVGSGSNPYRRGG